MMGNGSNTRDTASVFGDARDVAVLRVRLIIADAFAKRNRALFGVDGHLHADALAKV